MRAAFLSIDSALADEFANAQDGCTALLSAITPTHVVVANCGDTRAVLCRNGDALALSHDHKPCDDKETARIEHAGGFVNMSTNRVNGILAVSRALGDFQFKRTARLGQCEQLVSPEPDIVSMSRDPTDEFIVIACDGIWDVMTNEECVKFVRERFSNTDGDFADLQEIAKALVTHCYNVGST